MQLCSLCDHFRLQLVDDLENSFVLRNVGHRIAVMLPAHLALLIDDKHGRHASEFKEGDFLVIAVGDFRADVRAAGEGEVILLPVPPERIRAVWAESDNFHSARCKLIMVLAQLRQMRAAVGSGKPAQQDQDNFLFSQVI